MSRKPRIKNHLSSFGRDISFIILVFVSLVSFLNILVLSLKYSSGTEQQAVVMAETYADEARNAYLNKMNSLREKSNAIAVAASSYTDKIALDDFLYNITLADGYKEEDIKDIRYFYKDGKEYSHLGEEITDENRYVKEMRTEGIIATYGIIYYAIGDSPKLACYCPVPQNVDNSQIIDGIVVLFPQQTALSFTDSLSEEKTQISTFQAVCYQKSLTELQILKTTSNKNAADSENIEPADKSFANYLKNMTNDGVTGNEVNEIIAKGESGVTTIYLGNELYILTIGRANESDSGLCVITLYKADDIYSEGYDLVTSIITTMVLLGVVLLGFGLYYIISRNKMRRHMTEMNMINATLNCPTLLKYEKDAKDIFARNKATSFAVVISHVHHFNYITETFGETATNNMLVNIKETFASALMVEETYGYIENGEFVLLLHYKEKERLENRLVGLYAMIRRSSVQYITGYNLTMCYGIYEAEKGTEEPVQRMVEKAMVVKNLPSRSDVNQICHFYTETVKSDYLHRAEIEGRMEGALASGEFRVFYQPKYNLEKNYIDGAELLVRWYDPAIKKYRRPNEFLPVFEANGFISKLDRHIYYTACETLAKRIAEGKRTFPISVNVSRVTAIQPDFIAYYIKVKNKFRIADGVITLEFTESFAYENYEYLSTVAKDLRKAGFLCSIDDFGTGYSSYNVLKTLEIDEIKMDKFFLDQGPSSDRDRLIIESVIDVSKKLKVKITQEGVETLEQLKLLRDLGCTVIQGYYFAKPMSLNDYDNFIEDFFASNKITKELKNK